MKLKGAERILPPPVSTLACLSPFFSAPLPRFDLPRLSPPSPRERRGKISGKPSRWREQKEEGPNSSGFQGEGNALCVGLEG